ncbi:hypothetical protein HDU97_006167 [Phlyctochytrium planicorne]|nr:hypothetical protein HDU97_006167 [Phlyctochytrium planicorne]
MAESWRVFDELLQIITAAYHDGGHKVIKPLELKLSRLRPKLKALLEEEGKSDEKRKEIQSGRLNLNGRVEHANAEFIKSALILSDLLNINEIRAASLLKHAISCQDYDRDAVDVAVIEYNRERLSLLECLELIIKGSNDRLIPSESRSVFASHVKEIFGVEMEGNGNAPRESTLLRKILDTLAQTKNCILALRDDATVPGMVTGSTLKTQGVSESVISNHAELVARVRWYLASVHYSAVHYRYSKTSDAIELMEILRDVDSNDNVWVLQLMSLLSSLRPPEMENLPLKEGDDLKYHIAFLKQVSQAVYGPTARWSVRALQELVGVQFSIHIKQIRLHHQQIEFELALSEPLDGRLEHGLHSFPFQFMVDHMLTRSTFYDLAGELDSDIVEHAFKLAQQMIEVFLKRMGKVVRTLKNKAEDIESNPNRVSQTYSGEPAVTPFESIISIVTHIFRDRPESGIQFWKDPELFKFLRFMMDIRSNDLMRSFLEMLASLATGQQCAHYAAEFLSTDHSRLSWEALFRSLDLTAKSLAAHPDGVMHPGEIALQKAFLRLLGQVVKFSSVARASLHASPHLQAINTLFSLLNRRIPYNLKAALFETAAAFCIPAERGVPSDISAYVWRHLELSEVIPKPVTGSQYAYGSFSSTTSRQTGRSDGLRYDLDQIESQYQTYPETIAFLQLLNTLLISMKTLSSGQSNSVDIAGFGPQTSFSITHYIEFVLDDVFLKIHNRLFTSIDERWKMIELSLRICDQCVRNFDTVFREPTIAAAERMIESEESSIDSPLNSNLASHPACTILCRILSGSALIKRIFDVIKNGVEAVNTHGKKCPAFASSTRLALRLILRVLQVQTYFLDMLASDRNLSVKYPVSTTGLDQLMAFYREVIIHIALFVNCEIDDEICLLSINILTILSQSPVFNSMESTIGTYGKMNRLISLLSSSEESNQIIGGFVHRLEIEQPESIEDINMQLTSTNLANVGLQTDLSRDPELTHILFEGAAVDPNAESAGFANLIRLAILDLLITNVHDSRPFPTISHYLLGYNLRKGSAEVEILDPNSPKGRIACLHVILDLLRAGTTRESGRISSIEDSPSSPLFEKHPKLAEKCFQLVYRICASRTTSSATMRYLRTTEDFFFNQLQSFPIDKISGLELDGDHEELSESSLRKVASSKLHQRAWLLKLIALELHITTLAGQRSQVQRLLDLLFINPVTSELDAQRSVGWGSTSFSGSFFAASNRSQFEQPLTKILEILNSIDFSKGKFLSPATSSKLNSPLLTEGDANKCQRVDEYGRPVYDIRQAFSILTSRRLNFEKQGAFAVPPDQARIQSEAAWILHELLRRNCHIESLGSRIHCIQGWCQIVQVTLAHSFDLLPAELREEKLYELLANLFPKINAPDTANDFVELAANVILSLLSRLRSDRVYQSILQSALTMADPSHQALRLPADSLQQVVLRGLLDGIVRSGSSSTLRANYYGGLISFLHYTNPDDLESRDRGGGVEKDHSSTSFFAAAQNEENRNASYRTSLVLGNLSVINSYGDRLLEILCKDASDGPILLKTVSFSVLDSLCCLSSHEKPNRIVHFMTQRNYLNDFVRNLTKREDKAIQNLLRNEIEKLLECGIADALTECRFIECKPEPGVVGADDMDISSPQGKENYHQAVLPVLKLICTIVQAGKDNAHVVSKLSLFLQKHQDALMSILRDKAASEDSDTMLQRQLVFYILSSLGGCRSVLELEAPGPANRSFHNIILSLARPYVSSLDEIIKNDSDSADDSAAKRNHILHVCRSILSYCDVVTGGEYVESPPEETLLLVFSSLEQNGNGCTVKDSMVNNFEDSFRISPSVIIKLLAISITQYFAKADAHKNLRIKINDLKRLPVDEINTVVRHSGESIVNDLSSSQRQQLAGREYRRRLKQISEDLLSFIYLIDHSLLLLWRYFQYSDRKVKDSVAPEMDTLEKLKTEFRGLLAKLSTFQITQELSGNSEARNAYIQMLVRKLREII